MLKFLKSMLCTSRIHPSSPGNFTYHRGNVIIIRVAIVEWTWLGYLKSKGDYAFGYYIFTCCQLCQSW